MDTVSHAESGVAAEGVRTLDEALWAMRVDPARTISSGFWPTTRYMMMFSKAKRGRQYDTATDIPFGYIPENKDLFLLDRINPGLSQAVRVVFSVPPDAQGFEMEVSSGFFATETRRIALGF